LLASLNAAYLYGEMSVSQRRGVITLIPKDDSNLLELSNLRPITLLNVDYKIASKAIASRIKHRHARRARVIFVCEVSEIEAFMVQ